MEIKPRKDRNPIVKVITKKNISNQSREFKNLFSDTKILAIENNDLHLKYYKSLLPNCVLCKTPAEGLRQLRNEKFDIVILDYFFKEKNGIELINEIKKESLNSEIQSLLITNAESGLNYKTLNFFDNFIFRPAKPMEIYEKLQNLL